MEINYALIGKRIRETRKQRGLSAEELAEIADLSTVYISYIENNFRNALKHLGWHKYTTKCK